MYPELYVVVSEIVQSIIKTRRKKKLLKVGCKIETIELKP